MTCAVAINFPFGKYRRLGLTLHEDDRGFGARQESRS